MFALPMAKVLSLCFAVAAGMLETEPAKAGSTRRCVSMATKGGVAGEGEAESPCLASQNGGVSLLQAGLSIHDASISNIKKSSASSLQEAQGPVFFLGLQKSGTSAFASFMNSIGIPTMHLFSFSNLLWGKAWELCEHPLNGTEFPLHEAFAREILPESRAVFEAWLSNHTPFATADQEWPLMFRFLDEHTEGRAKFVIWRRNPAEWAESFLKFFGQFNTFGQVDRLTYLSYGQFRKSDLDREQLAKAYESHNNAVLEYFNDPSRRSRLLDLDFTSLDAGHVLCTFVLGKSTTCDEYTYLPDVQPEELVDLFSADESNALVKEMKTRLPAVSQEFGCPELSGAGDALT